MQEFNIDTINRDASDKYKGFRYQKFRVAIKMLQLIKKNNRNNIIALPEFRDDGHFVDENGNEYLEQDKLYEKGFSFNSSEIQKSMINFLDNFIELKKDPYINFIFFTNTTFKGENQTKKLTELGLTVLQKPVIQYLVDKDFEKDVIDFVSKYLINIYKETYDIQEDKPDTYHVNYITIKKMESEEWINFLSKVSFRFGEGDLDKLSEELEREISECQFFSAEHLGKENLIKRNLLDVIDERMTQKHVTQKIIGVDSVRYIYKEVESSNSELVIDEVHLHWENIENELENDSIRNLKEKILCVCPEINEKTLKKYTRESVTVKDEIKRFDRRQINSLRYRVYESMGIFFEEEFNYSEILTIDMLNETIKLLKEFVLKDIDQLKKDYSYGIKNDIAVKKMTMLLIDECFYSFDEV
ncbi:hypothetical protein [Exiguobacterium undae]|uniref:Uncharacterized protein n=1 Tax=Exiguobacterium undae TaxID=169177 RepID=A0ABX2V8U5_9BACL|nr:hypothetical protein [Exiguobacterium undae]OAN14606.1 hypothetical protein A3783_01365 [Exiguobacterium undae]